MSKEKVWVVYDGRYGTTVKVPDAGEFTRDEPREVRANLLPVLLKAGGMFHEGKTVPVRKAKPKREKSAAKRTTAKKTRATKKKAASASAKD